MYVIVAIVMLLRGFADAVMMRSQQVLASAGKQDSCHLITTIRSLPPTALSLIFFVAMPFVIGLMEPGGSASARRA